MLGTATEVQGPAFAASRLLLLPGLCSEELRFGKRSSYSLSSQVWCSNAVTIRLPINSGRCRLTSNKSVSGDRRHSFRARSAVWGADEYPGTGPRCSPAHGSRVAGLPATQSCSNNLQLVTPIAPRLAICGTRGGSSSAARMGGSSRRPSAGHSLRYAGSRRDILSGLVWVWRLSCEPQPRDETKPAYHQHRGDMTIR